MEYLYMLGVLVLGMLVNYFCSGKKKRDNFNLKHYMGKNVLEDFDDEQKKIDKYMK